jgi:hypothetical protein
MSDPIDLTQLLGTAKSAWDAVRDYVAGQPGTTTAWKFYGQKHGWQLKVMAKRRALVYLIPRAGTFTAAVALREPAIAALRATAFPSERLRTIEQARASTEGKPARIEVTSARQVPLVKLLVSVKLAT